MSPGEENQGQSKAPEPKPQPKRVERFPCPACAGGMEFDPATGKMKCTYCGHLEAMPEHGAVTAHPFVETDGQNIEKEKISEQALEVHCAGCGSVVAFQPPQVAGTCSFCGASIVDQPKSADPLIAPDGVLPAKIPKATAQTNVQKWLQTRWFAPNALKRMAHPDAVSGMYLPFWIYDCDTDTVYHGERGDYYYTTESYTDSDGHTQTREVQHIAWRPASGEVRQSFYNVLIPATRSISTPRLNKLAPWGLNALCPYEPAYLAGFKAQRYQLELVPGFEEAKKVMQPTIERDIRQDIGGDQQRITTMNTGYFSVTFRHLLLPVWLGAYQFQGKSYQVVINASTGDVEGERPYSAVKIIMLIVFILLVIGVIVIANQH